MGFRGVTQERILAQWERMRPMEPAVFARRTLDDVLDNVAIIVHPKWWKALWYVERLSPSLGMKVWSLALAKLRRDLVRDGAELMAPRRPPAGDAGDAGDALTAPELIAGEAARSSRRHGGAP